MLLSREELNKSSVLHPEIANFLSKNPTPRSDPSDYQAMRHMVAMAMKSTGAKPPPSGTTEFYHEISMRDGYKSSLKVHKPDDGSLGPLIVLFFGGGFAVGNNGQMTETARALVQLFGATVVSPNYRLAPEHKFPTGQLDAWDSMKWLADNATGEILRSDPAKGFIIGGISAGGAISAVLSRKFYDEPLAHPLTGQWLCIPSTMDSTRIPEGYEEHYIANDQNSDTPILNQETRRYLKEWAQWDITSDLRYATNSKTPMSAQPQTYFQIDCMDPLRDDGLIYDEMLKKSGVTTKVDLYYGCPHAHFAAFRGLKISAKANIDTIVGFGWLLGEQTSRDEVAGILGQNEK